MGDLGKNVPANLLRNALMKIYSKQLETIEFDEGVMEIDTHSFESLKSLAVDAPNGESFRKIIELSKDLQNLFIDRMHSAFENHRNDETLKNAMILSLEKFKNMKEIFFRTSAAYADKLITMIEIGLLKTKEIKRKSLKIFCDFTSSVSKNEMKAEDVRLFFHRIVHKLAISNIDDYMVVFRISDNINGNKLYMKEIGKDFKNTHLVFLAEDNLGDDAYAYGLVVSKKSSDLVGYNWCYNYKCNGFG